jgi:hypothetical protein
MKAISLRGIRDLPEGDAPLPDEAMAPDQASALLVMGGFVRGQRTSLLRATDWTQIADNNLTAQQRTAFAAYRASLRDVPEQPGFPFVTWPQAPTLQSGAGSGTGETS